ncbi:hypothetical protein [Pseudonocardia thermophila]|uniref:hypothetical protein n=1 Tax=Pseudonocardia thermophila TaxID=1848 RepID=UPI00248D6A18|nr:hypothetical protein [Pseudonocardia thermophila]
MSRLADWVQGVRDTLTWLDADRYVRAVFAGGTERWYDDPATLASATVQAQSVLRSDVLPVKVLGPFAGLLAGAGDDAAAVCAALGAAEPRAVLTDTLDALAHQLGAEVDLVLDCPSPRRLVGGADVGFDALDDIASALLEVIRAVADRPVRALVFSCDTASGPDDEETDSWSSALAAASHYGWLRAVRLDAVTAAEQVNADVSADLLLFPNAAPDALPDDRTLGGGLVPAAWADSTEADLLTEAAAERGFRFGEIPQEAAPETVLRRIAVLAAGR